MTGRHVTTEPRNEARRGSRPACATLLALLVVGPVVGGANEGGCAPMFSKSPAPNVVGTWAVDYDDTIGVEVTLGGAVYTTEIGIEGGSFTIDHDGTPITFDLDCARPEVVCPSEAFPATVRIEQREPLFPHRMHVMLPSQECAGVLVDPMPFECGSGTLNPDCEQVCDGDVVTVERETFGVIGEDGSTFELYLGAAIATNGINCALLGGSMAEGQWVTDGGPEQSTWEATGITEGVLTVGYAGGCLWADDVDSDGDLEAAVVSAGIRFTTGFTATRF